MTVRQIWRATCDECGDAQEVKEPPEQERLVGKTAVEHPRGWHKVGVDDSSAWVCSIGCAVKWVNHRWNELGSRETGEGVSRAG